jgi:hypothetical protein
MKIAVSIILTLTFMIAIPYVHASGSHHGFGYGAHYGYGSHFGFVNSHYPYSYRHPYFSPSYVVSTQQSASMDVYPQRAKIVSREKSAYCREYMKKIVVDGKKVRTYGTACLQEEGSWRIVN